MTVIGWANSVRGQQKYFRWATTALCSGWTHTRGYAAPRGYQYPPASSLRYDISLPMRGRAALDQV